MLHKQTTAVPSAHITVDRNRSKLYNQIVGQSGSTYESDGIVYFKDDSNYEIELFNPTTKRVLAMIEIDGKLISNSGLILNPGQRHYLERWIDEPKKFLFSTYDVEDSAEVKSAIQNNGKVTVKFYNEEELWKNPIAYGGSTITHIVNPHVWPPTVNPYQVYCGTSGDNINASSNTAVFTSTPSSGYTTRVNGAGTYDGKTLNACYSHADWSSCVPINDSISYSVGSELFNNSQVAGSIETGRTEQGELSEQTFLNSSGNFSSYTTAEYNWKILPESVKPVEVSEIRQYCPNCRNRIRKQSWKFCPGCGEQL